ncbi:MAG: DMT family transporter [Pyrinomonadaceae bacterium]
METTEEHNSLAPHLALLAVQFMFGTASVLGKMALVFFPSTAIVGFRVGGGATAFYLLARFRGKLALDEKRHYLQFAVFSIFGISMNQLLFFKGLSLTTATNASLLAVLIPVFAILVGGLLKTESLSWRKLAGILFAAAGVVYLINPAKASFLSGTTAGDMLILANSLSYAFYLAISKKLITHYGPLRSIAWLFIFGSIVNVPVGVYSLSGIDLGEVSRTGWYALAGVVIVPTIMAYYWNTWALARVEPSVVAIYVYFQPVIGTLLAISLLGEVWNPRLLVAMILIFLGVFLATSKTKRKRILPAA